MNRLWKWLVQLLCTHKITYIKFHLDEGVARATTFCSNCGECLDTKLI